MEHMNERMKHTYPYVMKITRHERLIRTRGMIIGVYGDPKGQWYGKNKDARATWNRIIIRREDIPAFTIYRVG